MKKEILVVTLAGGLLVGCATHEPRTAELRDLPMPVQQAVLRNAPDADIAKVKRQIRNNEAVYEISFHQPHRNPELHVASDGAILKGGRRLMHEPAGAARMDAELVPDAVWRGIHAHAPNARVADVDREVRDGRVVYEVQFSEPGLNPKLHFTEDGTLIDVD